MFTGYVTEEELRTERPDEYARLERQGKLAELEVEPVKPGLINAGRAYGVVVNALGLILVGLMLYALLG
jgi:hypothetical protein